MESDTEQMLINNMETAFPNAQLAIALQIDAKVHKGEMEW